MSFLVRLLSFFTRFGLTFYELLKFACNWGVSVVFVNFLPFERLIAHYEIIAVWIAAFTSAPIWASLQYYSASLGKENNTALLKLIFSWLLFSGGFAAAIIGGLVYLKFHNFLFASVLLIHSFFLPFVLFGNIIFFFR